MKFLLVREWGDMKCDEKCVFVHIWGFRKWDFVHGSVISA